MRTIVIIFLVVYSFFLFHAVTAHPLADSEIVSDDAIISDPVPVRRPSKDITIDAAIQANAHVVVPGPVAEKLLQIMVEAIENSKKYGKANGLQSRSKLITCDLLDASGWSKTLCAAHCILLGHSGGYCNSRSVCQCRD